MDLLGCDEAGQPVRGPQGDQGFGNGDQDAPGGSLLTSNAENAGGEDAVVYPGGSGR